MGQMQTPFLVFLALLILSSTSLASSLRHQNSQRTQTSSVFSLPLYPHDSIINDPQNQNYTHRTISLLTSDRARVRYINSRLRKALFNSNDPNSQLEEESVQQPPDSALSYTGGEYAVRVGVGNPVREFSLMVDTGSDVTWIRCKPCNKCHEPTEFFNTSRSSSYQPLFCDSQQCNALEDKKGPCSRSSTCSYISRYADYSRSTGEYATETLRMGSSGSVDQVAIGCEQTKKGFEDDYAGVLGLSWSPIAFPSQISAKSFSYCLSGADSKSPSTLEFNSAQPADSVIVPMSTNGAYYYYVELTGITVGEDLIQIPSSVYEKDSNGIGGIIVDSGTVLTYLDGPVYTQVVDAFRKNIKNLPASKRYDTCYDVPSGTSASSLDGPPISLHFHNQTTPPLGPANYLYRVANDSTYCLAFKPRTKNDKASIIGNVQQTGMRVTYDLQNKLTGFSTNKC